MALTPAQLEEFTRPFEDDEPEDTSALQQTLTGASYKDPDQFAQDRKLGNRLGVPTDLVSTNRDEIKRQSHLTGIDLEAFVADAPKTAEWLKNPDNAQSAYDDLDFLSKMEQETNRSWISVDSRVFKGLGDSMMIGLGKSVDQVKLALASEKAATEDHVLNLIQTMRDEGKDKVADKLQEQVNTRKEARDKEITKHIESLKTADEEIGRLTPEGLTTSEEGLRGAVQMVTDMLPGIGISIATRGAVNPTLAMLTAKTGMESYGSARVEGLSHEEALAYGTIDAGLEWATERLPMKKLEKIFGEMGGAGGIKSSLKGWMVQEAAGEQIATLTQTMNAYAFELDEQLANATSMKEVVEIQGRRQAVTFIATLFGGGTMSASIKGVDYLANRERRAMTESLKRASIRAGSAEEQDRLDNIIFLAQASKTNERDAETFKDFLEKTTDQFVYISVDVIDELEDPPAFLTDLVDGSRADVQVSMADFLAEFANDESKLAIVRNHVKTAPNLLTQTEMEDDSDSDYIKNLLDRAAQAKETKEAADAMFDQVVDELVGTGRMSQATATQAAALYPAMVTTQYEDLKDSGVTNEDGSEITVQQLYEDMGFRITGPQEKVGETTSQQEDFINQEIPEHLSQTEALEYEQAIQRGLDMSEPSRIARANEQGYDTGTVLWRADDWTQPMELDETNSGAVYLSPSRTAIWTFAESHSKPIEEITEEEKAFMEQGTSDENATPKPRAFYIKPGNQITAKEATRILRDGGSRAQRTGRHVSGLERSEVQILRDAGVDSIVGPIDGLPGTEVVLINPAAIRSVDAAFAPELSESPSLLSQQDFSNIQISTTVTDEAGNVIEMVESAQTLWEEQQRRMTMVQDLRSCLRA